ncbi:MAG: 50S ribosomal protein L16 [Minisyncoccales bacterium]|jgi:large subunit ribosomal protein L16
MFTPKKTKYRKQMKGRRRNRLFTDKGTTISFGTYGLKAMSPAWITSNQLEACRRVLIRYVRKTGKMWIRVFPNKVITRKGSEVPMGGGKGNPDHYVVIIKPGKILFELEGIPEKEVREAFKKCGDKLPLKVKFVKKEI